MIRDTSDQDTKLARPPRNWHKSPRLWAAFVGLVVLVSFAFPYVKKLQSASMSVPLEKVRLGTVQRADLIRDVSAQGKIIAAVKPVLYSPAPGRVSLKVRAGDTVEEGSLIAQIFSPELISQHQQENSQLESLRSEVKRQEIQTRTEQLALQQNLDLAEVTSIAASREKRRADTAYEKGIISVQDFEKAGDDLNRAELEHQHLKDANILRIERLNLELEMLNHDFSRQQFLVNELLRKIDELAIISPVTGVVGNVEVNEMDFVSQYQVLLSVVDLSVYEVEVEVPESHADDLALGIDAEIKLGNETFAGLLTSISPEVQNGKVNCQVRFKEGSPASLRQNQCVSVRILLETKFQTLTVNRGNFMQATAGRYAYLVTDGVATKTAIEVGSTSVSKVEIVGGLEEGDVIVISGAGYFDDQDQVLLIN
jgi:HlyD family secretion protein